MNHPNLIEFAKSTAKEAGNILMEYFGNIFTFEHKSTEIDLLTIADTKSESYIIDRIKSTFPEHRIIAEESDITDGNSDYRWVIDPLDGTTNFVHNLPIFSISIAFQYKEETLLGGNRASLLSGNFLKYSNSPSRPSFRRPSVFRRAS